MPEEKGNYIEERINAFEGINSYIAPELIKDTQGRQVLNLYPEKLGKLSTRTGYQFGAYLKCKTRSLNDVGVLDPVSTPYLPKQLSANEPFEPETIIHNLYPYNLGVYWIGEINLEHFWQEIDTNKLMVYAIIGNAFDESLSDPSSSKSQSILDYLALNKYIEYDSSTGKYKISRANPLWQVAFNNIDEFRLPIQYLFVPMTGKYRNIILDPYFVTDITVDKSKSAYQIADWNTLPPNPAGRMYKAPFDWRRGTKVLRAPHRFWNIETDYYGEYFNDLQVHIEEWFLNHIGNYPSEYKLQDILIDNPIKHFGHASWYQNSLIISDPINGDQIIRDLYDFSSPGCESLPHALLIQPNCLESFDVNIVDIDPRFNTGEENDVNSGVTNGMALYGFVLPKKITKGFVDVSDDTLTDLGFLSARTPEETKNNAWWRELKVMQYMVDRKSTTLITAVTRSMYNTTTDSKLPDIDNPLDSIDGMAIKNPHRYSFIVNINNDYYRLFSNTQSQIEFTDLLGEPDFNEEVVVDASDPSKMVTKKEKPADVYIWEDFKLNYYPTYGREKANAIYKYLLRDIDRTFHKALPKAPRIVSLDPKINAGKYAPLGIWNYRFVWDFGGGVYSAPSTVLSAPDIMWSAVSDDEMTDSNGNYNRPLQFNGAPKNDWRRSDDTWIEPQENRLTTNFLPKPVLSGVDMQDIGIICQYNAAGNIIKDLPWWDDLDGMYLKRAKIYKSVVISQNSQGQPILQIELTKYGELLWKLKRKIYNGISGRYSNPAVYQGNDTDDYSQILTKGTAIIDFPVLVTGYFGDAVVETEGTAWQFVKLDAEAYGNALIPDTLKVDFGGFTIPLFQQESIGRSRFSLFDEEGRYRLSFLKKNKFLESDGSEAIFPNIFWAAPWRVQPGLRGSTSEYGGANHYDMILAREPSEQWMDLYLLFVSDYDFHNLPPRFFQYNPSEPDFSIYTANFSVNYKRQRINPFSYLCWYLYRPTNFIRGLRSDSDNNSLAIAGKDIPNQVYDRLIKVGTIELQVVKATDYVAPWYFMQQLYGFLSQRDGTPTFAGFGPIGFAECVGTSITPDRYNYPAIPSEIVSETFNNGVLPIIGKVPILESYRYQKIGNLFDPIEYYNEDIYITHIYKDDDKGKIIGYVCNRPVFSYTARGFLPIPLSVVYIDGVTVPNRYYSCFHYRQGNYSICNRYYSKNPFIDDIVYKVNKDYYKYACLHNVDIYVYGNGHRLLAPEQLTAYFPSSLLFKAPRLGIRINSEKIPRLAKKLLVFRSLNTNNNEYDPNSFGLVKEIEILRYEDSGEPYTQYKLPDGNIQTVNGIYWFDDVTEDKIDFSISPIDYDGLKRPLRSRFHITLNERTYYYNFVELYRPESLRENNTYARRLGNDNIPAHPNNQLDTLKYYANNYLPSSIAYAVDSISPNEGYSEAGDYIIEYGYAAEDDLGKIGEPSFLRVDFTVGATPKVIVLSLVPIPYDGTVKQIKLYRKIVMHPNPAERDTDFYLIDIVKIGLEGIYTDTGKVRQALMPCWDYEFLNYPTGLRWSEPYRPDWIKIGSQWTEYKEGFNGTGIEENYGNLVLFTDISCARYTVQAADPPISRVDELSPNIGCIAPHTLLNFNNSLAFLSWQGWMYYDNNVFINIDDVYAQEIVHLLSHTTPSLLSYATGGIHQHLNSIYLNMPHLLSKAYDVYIPYVFDSKYLNNYLYPVAGYISSLYYDWGDYERFNKLQKLWGNIFVRNLPNKYGTKISYQSTVLKQIDAVALLKFYKLQFHSLGNTRLYYNNSLGELRSADIYPNKYRNEETQVWDWYWSGLYIESAYPTSLGKDTPVYANFIYNNQSQQWEYKWSIIKELDEDVVPVMPNIIRWTGRRIESLEFSDYGFDYFPKPFYLPVRWLFFSKFFNSNDETGLKRLRKLDVNIYNQGPITLRGVTFHREEEINYIVEFNINKPNQNVFQFNSVNDYYSTPLQQLFSGREQSVLSIIPSFEWSNIVPFRPVAIDDWNGKPLKFSLELYGIKRATLSEIGFYWRPIHRYLL